MGLRRIFILAQKYSALYGGKSAQKLKWYRAVVYNFTNKKIHMVSRISYIPLDMKKDVQFIREQKNVFSARRKFYSTHA